MTAPHLRDLLGPDLSSKLARDAGYSKRTWYEACKNGRQISRERLRAMIVALRVYSETTTAGLEAMEADYTRDEL